MQQLLDFRAGDTRGPNNLLPMTKKTIPSKNNQLLDLILLER